MPKQIPILLILEFFQKHNKMSVSTENDQEMVNGTAKEEVSISPWKKPKISENEKMAMNSSKVVHSSYVPGQIERHLEFMNFNDGMILRDFEIFFSGI